MRKTTLDLKNLDFEKISDNHYFGTMTFRDYLLSAKENVIKESDRTIVYKAELEATKYNNDTEISEIFISPVSVFITEDGILIFDVFTTRMIFDLEERFMDNKLGVNVYTVSLAEARKIIMQIDDINNWSNY